MRSTFNKFKMSAKKLNLRRTIKMTKPAKVLNLTGVGNSCLGIEYVSIFESDPSRSTNFLSIPPSSHPRLLTKSEPKLNFISPRTTPPAVVKAFVQHLDLTTDPIHF